jgi:mRNA interferase MazF
MVTNLQQGQIWWVDLPESDSQQPVLIVQSNAFNRSDLQTVVCIGLTPDWKLAEAPGNVIISQSDSGLPKSSVANVSQLLTIDKSFLTEYVSSVPSFILESILDGIQLMIGR